MGGQLAVSRLISRRRIGGLVIESDHYWRLLATTSWCCCCLLDAARVVLLLDIASNILIYDAACLKLLMLEVGNTKGNQ